MTIPYGVSSGYLRLGGSVPGKHVSKDKFIPFDKERKPGDMSHTDPRASHEAPLSMEPGPAKMSKAEARTSGFTGDQCDNCGSMRMVNTGTCKSCQDCATTTGCS